MFTYMGIYDTEYMDRKKVEQVYGKKKKKSTKLFEKQV